MQLNILLLYQFEQYDQRFKNQPNPAL